MITNVTIYQSNNNGETSYHYKGGLFRHHHHSLTLYNGSLYEPNTDDSGTYIVTSKQHFDPKYGRHTTRYTNVYL